jgi:ABC-type Fe3+-hydroxamate transport system substrate-binding protein
MKFLLTIICAVAFSTALASAQTSSSTTTSTSQGSQTTTTTSTTESVGTISEFTPGATLVLSSGTGEPVHYKLGKDVTYINAKGKVISADRIRKDRKVRVHYVKEGNDMVVDKVTIVKD